MLAFAMTREFAAVRVRSWWSVPPEGNSTGWKPSVRLVDGAFVDHAAWTLPPPPPPLPGAPLSPLSPFSPGGPAGPAGPAGPRAPCAPAAPAGPAGPAGPCAPVLELALCWFELSSAFLALASAFLAFARASLERLFADFASLSALLTDDVSDGPPNAGTTSVVDRRTTVRMPTAMARRGRGMALRW